MKSGYCTSPRLIPQRHKIDPIERLLIARCGQCPECLALFKRARIDRLYAALLRWERVEFRMVHSDSFDTLKRKLQRKRICTGQRLAHAAIAMGNGYRAVFTEASIAGDAISPELLRSRIEEIVSAASADKHVRLDGSRGWSLDVGGFRKSPQWEKKQRPDTILLQQVLGAGL